MVSTFLLSLNVPSDPSRPRQHQDSPCPHPLWPFFPSHSWWQSQVTWLDVWSHVFWLQGHTAQAIRRLPAMATGAIRKDDKGAGKFETRSFLFRKICSKRFDPLSCHSLSNNSAQHFMHQYVNISKLLALVFASFFLWKIFGIQTPSSVSPTGIWLPVGDTETLKASFHWNLIHSWACLPHHRGWPITLRSFPSLTSSAQILLVGLQQHSLPEWIHHWGSSLLQVKDTGGRLWDF